jgi:hypothetical protein
MQKKGPGVKTHHYTTKEAPPYRVSEPGTGGNGADFGVF